MMRSIFGDDYPALKNKDRTVGIWNAVDSKYRRSSKSNPAEDLLYKKNAELIEFALTNRIYYSGYLSYRGAKKGFLHDAPSVARPDFFGRTKKDLSNVCEEMRQRFQIAS